MTPEQNLKKLGEILKLMNEGVTRADFEKSFAKVLELVVAMEKRNSQAIAQMQQTHSEMFGQMNSMHASNYADLKGKVNDVLIGNEFKKILKENNDKLAEMIAKVNSVQDGKTPTNEELTALIKPLIPEPPKAEDLTNIKEDIKQLIEDMKKQKSRIFTGGGIVGRDLIKDIDISSQLNGVLKTFNIPATWNVVTVSLSSYPYGSLRKNTDFTFTPTTITFTSTIDAATQLSTGTQCILTTVTA